MSQPSFDLDLDPTPTFRVSELAGAIGAAVRKGFPEEVWVRGEIDSLSRSAAGHLYFDLVEGVGNERMALRVALFRTVAEAVERHLAKHRMRLENGLEVRIRGRVELYEARGQVNLRMSGIDPTYTLGRLAQDRDRLVRLLTGEGLVERNRRLVARLGATPHRHRDEPRERGVRRLHARARSERLRVARHGRRQPRAGRRGDGVGRARTLGARSVLARRSRRRPRRRQPQRARCVRRRAHRTRDRRDARARAHGHRARGRSVDRRPRRSHVPEDADGVRRSSHRAGARLTWRAEPICDGHRAVCSHRARPQRAEREPHRDARAARRESRPRRRLVQRAKRRQPGPRGRRRNISRPRISESTVASPGWSVDCPRRSVPPFGTSTASKREWSHSIRRGCSRAGTRSPETRAALWCVPRVR